MVFHADSSYKSRNEPPARDIVDHGIFLGDGERIIHQRKSSAEHGNLGLFGGACQGTRDDAGRGHQPVGCLVVFVHANAIISKCVRKFQFTQVAGVELFSFLGIIIAVRRDPKAFYLLKNGAPMQFGLMRDAQKIG